MKLDFIILRKSDDGYKKNEKALHEIVSISLLIFFLGPHSVFFVPPCP
jgi:hypothetical protein